MSGDEGVVIPLRGGAAARVHRGRRHPSEHDDAAVLDFASGPSPVPGSAAASSPAASSPPASSPAVSSPAVSSPPTRGWEQRLADGLAFVRRRLEGSYAVDEYGFDPELAGSVALPALRAIYDRWFRVEVNGVENIPDEGAALLVANHAGGLAPWDAAMTAVAVHVEHPRHRFLRPLAADLMFDTPALGTLARRAGATLACADDADRLLRSGELVGVWPEGFKGIGKPFRDRYELQRFGRGGFVRSAIRASAPIIPVSIVGAEEIHPVVANASVLARLLNLPYFPITPTFPWLGPLGLVPLPSKWYLEFGAPIGTDRLDPSAADDPTAVFELVDQVRERIQHTLARLLTQRRSVWR